MGDDYKIPKLNGDNYHSWAIRARAAMVQKRCWEAVDPGYGANMADAERRKNDEALTLMFLLVEDTFLDDIGDCERAAQAWDALKIMHTKFGLLHVLQLMKDFFNVEMKPGEAVQSYLGRLMDIHGKLSSSGYSFTDREVALVMLIGLPKAYEPLILNLEKDEENMTMTLVKSSLIIEEKRISRKETNNYMSPPPINVINEADYREDLLENNCFKDVPPLPLSSTEHDGSKIGDNVPGLSPLAGPAKIPSVVGLPPDYFSFQNPHIFGDREMTDSDDQFDDEFWKLIYDGILTEIESKEEAIQTCKTFGDCPPKNPQIFGDWEKTNLERSSNNLQNVDKSKLDDEFWRKQLKKLSNGITEIESKEGDSCSKHWSYCRDYYNQRRGKPITGSCGDAGKKRSFLDSGPSSQKEDTFSNVPPLDVSCSGTTIEAQDPESEGEGEDSSRTLVHDELEPPKKKTKLNHADERLHSLKELVQQRETTDNSAVDFFYKSIATTVKGLPLREQMLLQMEISTLVGNAVIRNIDFQSSSSMSEIHENHE